MKKIVCILLLGASLEGCMTYTWAPGPNARGPFSEISAGCSMMARNGGQGIVAYGRPGYVAGAMLGNAIANGIKAQADYNDCMAMNGFEGTPIKRTK